jgi:hypothetical protein
MVQSWSNTLCPMRLGEQQRLGLMSALLDPIERAPFAQLGVCPDWRCLELGCGNGSIAQVSRRTQIPEYVQQGCLAAFKSRNRPSLFVLKSVLPHFRCKD